MLVTVKRTALEREFFIKGDFNVKDEKRFFDVFLQIRSMKEKTLVFNLSECTFIDSAGMGMLVIAYEEAVKRNAVRVIRSASAEIRDILCSADFDKMYYFQ